MLVTSVSADPAWCSCAAAGAEVGVGEVVMGDGVGEGPGLLDVWGAGLGGGGGWGEEAEVVELVEQDYVGDIPFLLPAAAAEEVAVQAWRGDWCEVGGIALRDTDAVVGEMVLDAIEAFGGEFVVCEGA